MKTTFDVKGSSAKLEAVVHKSINQSINQLSTYDDDFGDQPPRDAVHSPVFSANHIRFEYGVSLSKFFGHATKIGNAMPHFGVWNDRFVCVGCQKIWISLVGESLNRISLNKIVEEAMR